MIKDIAQLLNGMKDTFKITIQVQTVLVDNFYLHVESFHQEKSLQSWSGNFSLRGLQPCVQGNYQEILF